MPTPGDALLIGLNNAVPSCAVLLRVDCRVAGVGVDPNNPPYVWEAWTGGPDWVPCEMERDETKAFNQPGDVVLHVPRRHELDSPPAIAGKPRGWLRCRLLAPAPGQPTYKESPLITSIVASTIGGTARMVNARVIRDESIGMSDGTPGQRFTLQHRPVLPWPGTSLSVTAGQETTDWSPVDHFAAEEESSRCFHIDPVGGEVVFGPAVREGDGAIRQYGAVPPKWAITADVGVPNRRWNQGKRRHRPDPGAEDQRAVRLPGGEPPAPRSAAPRPRPSMRSRRVARCCFARGARR